ncbi:MAG TPA: hypothetical protein PK514_08190 [Spirochaetota bacterium]|nr:hypothetical protein [Spirochaetota bacterium]
MEHAAIIDIRTPDEICINLEKAGLHILRIPPTDRLQGPLSAHPDMQLFIHDNNAFVQPHIDKSFLHQLEKFCNTTLCKTELHPEYPGDIAYNVACTGRFAIHSLERTDPAILHYLRDIGTCLIDTRQGYSKCSTLIVDETSIITADRSIDKSAREAGMSSLLIGAGHVDLPGYKYGFIGGATGRFMDMVLFTGSIEGHPDRDRIHAFIESRGLKVKILSQQKVLDIGSIIII